MLCSVHQAQMRWREAGISKAGKAYQGFWSCPTKNADGSYCRAKPVQEPQAQTQVDKNFLENLRSIEVKLDKLIYLFETKNANVKNPPEIPLDQIPF